MVARKQAQRSREIRLDDPAATVPPIPPGNALRGYRQISRGLMATDAACLVIALLVGYYLRYDNRAMPIGESLTVLFAPLLWLAAFQAFGLYAPQHLSPPEEFRRIFGASSVGIVLLVVASYWSHSSFSRLWMGATWVLALASELVTRRAWRHHQLRLKHRGRLSFRTLIVGTSAEAGRLAHVLDNPGSGFMPLGYVRGSDPVIWANTLPLLGDLEQLQTLIRNHAADCLFVASSALTFEDISWVAQAARKEGVEVPRLGQPAADLAILMKLRDPGHDVAVLERNPAGVTYGWGVVFWDDLLEGLRPTTRRPPTPSAPRPSAGSTSTCWSTASRRPAWPGTASAFAASGCSTSSPPGRWSLASTCVSRRRSRTPPRWTPTWWWPATASTAGCGSRDPDRFGTRIDTGRNQYMWLGTTRVFDAFTFAFVRTEAGWIWCHAYGFDATTSTFIVECSPETWAGLGFGRLGLEESVARLEGLFARQLDGHRLVAQAPDRDRAPWLAFRTVTNQRWRHGNLVLAGDAAHTTHFTIGSGTKLAIEDAIGLAGALGAHDDLGSALAAYERERKAALLLLQREARNSARWFEHLPRYIDLGAPRFAALLHQRRSQLLTRMSPSGYYRLRRTTDEFALFDRLWHWASSRRREREVRRGSRA